MTIPKILFLGDINHQLHNDYLLTCVYWILLGSTNIKFDVFLCFCALNST